MKKFKILALLLIICLITPFILVGCAEKEPIKPIQVTATITFDTGVENIKVNAITLNVGEKVTPPEQPIREGYRFIAWLKDGVIYNFDKMPEDDIKLTAYWLDMNYSEGELPIMSIDLHENYPLDLVNREDYIDSKISISNTEEQYEIDAVDAGFRGRGNGSWGGAGAKNGYKIKFKDKQDLFGREANKHWVIIACSNFKDTTMYRNYLAYNMANDIFSNIEYTTKAEWIEVYINGDYHGVYLLCEHVRVGKERVDIDSEYGVEDTGYLIEYDAYATGEEGVDFFKIGGVRYPFTVKSPDPEEYMDEGLTKDEYKIQVSYIQNYVQNVYNAALNHDYETFRSLVDIESFVDMYIIHELFKNTDTGCSSFFMYKKPQGKLFAGPVWDFDGTTNIDYDNYGDRTPQGIYVARDAEPLPTSSELFIELYKTDGFLLAVKNRWKNLSDKIENFIDDKMNQYVYEQYKTIMGKNFVLWDNKIQLQAEIDWMNDCRALKNWLKDRIDWLNYEWRLI